MQHRLDRYSASPHLGLAHQLIGSLRNLQVQKSSHGGLHQFRVDLQQVVQPLNEQRLCNYQTPTARGGILPRAAILEFHSLQRQVLWYRVDGERGLS